MGGDDQIITMDPPEHYDHRHLLMRQLTPKRLKENEDFVWRLADRQVDELMGSDEVELMTGSPNSVSRMSSFFRSVTGLPLPSNATTLNSISVVPVRKVGVATS